MKMDRVYRTITVTPPNAFGGIWGFRFFLDFEQINTQRVVVRWTEESIGCGDFTLSHYGVCWGCLFEAFQRVERIAEEHAKTWNKMDARCG